MVVVKNSPRNRSTKVSLKGQVLGCLELHSWMDGHQLDAVLRSDRKDSGWMRRVLKKLHDDEVVARHRESGYEPYRYWVPGGKVTKETVFGRFAPHLRAVNDVGVRLAQVAAERGDTFSYSDWNNEVLHQWGRKRDEWIRADGVYRYVTKEGEEYELIVELDRGTESVGTLKKKVLAYQKWHAAASVGATRGQMYDVVPPVLFVFDIETHLTETRIKRMIDNFSELQKPGVKFHATTLGWIQQLDPFRSEVAMSLSDSSTRVPVFM